MAAYIKIKKLITIVQNKTYNLNLIQNLIKIKYRAALGIKIKAGVHLDTSVFI